MTAEEFARKVAAICEEAGYMISADEVGWLEIAHSDPSSIEDYISELIGAGKYRDEMLKEYGN